MNFARRREMNSGALATGCLRPFLREAPTNLLFFPKPGLLILVPRVTTSISRQYPIPRTFPAQLNVDGVLEVCKREGDLKPPLFLIFQTNTTIQPKTPNQSGGGLVSAIGQGGEPKPTSEQPAPVNPYQSFPGSLSNPGRPSLRSWHLIQI